MGGKGYYRWQRDITRQLNNMLEKDKRAIESIMYVEAAKTHEYILNNIPTRKGDLKRSVFLDVYETENGSGVGVGISATQHGVDKFTNTKLAGWLLKKPNREPTYADKQHGRKVSNSQQQMIGVANALYDLKYNVRDAIKVYWASRQK